MDSLLFLRVFIRKHRESILKKETKVQEIYFAVILN